MSPELTALLAVFGLSTATGISAFVPLLAMGIAERAGWLTLTAPFDVVASTPMLALFALLIVAEAIGARSPKFKDLFKEVELIAALAAGAVVTGIQAGAVDNVNTTLLMLIGVSNSGATHITRSAFGPIARAPGVRGLGAPAAFGLSAAAIAAPWVVPLLIIGTGIFALVMLVFVKRLLTSLLPVIASAFPGLADLLTRFFGIRRNDGSDPPLPPAGGAHPAPRPPSPAAPETRPLRSVPPVADPFDAGPISADDAPGAAGYDAITPWNDVTLWPEEETPPRRLPVWDQRLLDPYPESPS